LVKTLRYKARVTIGNKNMADDVPIIVGNFDIGAGAVIIGRIKIVNNVSVRASECFGTKRCT